VQRETAVQWRGMAGEGAVKDSMQKIAQDARATGEELARLLLDSPLPPEEKSAWAELVPFMTVEQIGKFRDMLLSHMERQIFDEAEDIILAMKAEELKRQFAHAHILADANKALGALEKDVDALEGAVT
jgi:thioesterase domain-containing protein